MSGPHITVVGGANTDIVGIPSGRYAARDSNPGHVRASAGGVARNVAENLARLGAQVRLVTAFGSDADGDELERSCSVVGIDTSHSIIASGVPGSRYLAVLDGAGDLAAAVNDMRALEALTPDMLDRAAFVGADAVVLDTNLHASTIARAVELAGDAPVVLDPVSTAKSPAALPVPDRVRALKADLREAEALSGAAGAAGAGQRLLEAGTRWVFVSLGPEGIWAGSAEESFVLPAERATVVNVTGAGDAFTAGIAWGIATGATLRETARIASGLAALTVESERTVSDRVSAEGLRERTVQPCP